MPRARLMQAPLAAPAVDARARQPVVGRIGPGPQSVGGRCPLALPDRRLRVRATLRHSASLLPFVHHLGVAARTLGSNPGWGNCDLCNTFSA